MGLIGLPPVHRNGLCSRMPRGSELCVFSPGRNTSFCTTWEDADSFYFWVICIQINPDTSELLSVKRNSKTNIQVFCMYISICKIQYTNLKTLCGLYVNRKLHSEKRSYSICFLICFCTCICFVNKFISQMFELTHCSQTLRHHV